MIRRFGEVARLFLDAGHVVISTSNVFNQEDHSNLRLLAEPCSVVEVLVSDEPKVAGEPDILFSLGKAGNVKEAAGKIYEYLKEKKILTGHNYSI